MMDKIPILRCWWKRISKIWPRRSSMWTPKNDLFQNFQSVENSFFLREVLVSAWYKLKIVEGKQTKAIWALFEQHPTTTLSRGPHYCLLSRQLIGEISLSIIPSNLLFFAVQSIDQSIHQCIKPSINQLIHLSIN